MLRAFFYNLLKRAIQDLLEGTLKDIRREIAESRAEFLQSSKDLRREIAESRAEFRQEMAALNGRIDKLTLRIDALQDSQLAMQRDLIARIDKVNTDLIGRIDKVNTNLIMRTDKVNADLTVRIDGLTSRMDEFAREQARLAEGIAELKTERSVTADILHRLEKIEDKVYA